MDDESGDDFAGKPAPASLHKPVSSTAYIWANCQVRGWQVLIPIENRKCPRPEPPECVLSSHSSSMKLPSPTTQPRSTSLRLKPIPTQPIPSKVFPTESSAEVEVAFANSTSAWQNALNLPQPSSAAIPEKNFILSNIRNPTPPKRQTKTALLDQAANQLRESEIIGNSLAERLKLLNRKINR